MDFQLSGKVLGATLSTWNAAYDDREQSYHGQAVASHPWKFGGVGMMLHATLTSLMDENLDVTSVCQAALEFP